MSYMVTAGLRAGSHIPLPAAAPYLMKFSGTPPRPLDFTLSTTDVTLMCSYTPISF